MVAKTGAQRNKKYRKNNGECLKLQNLRYSVKTLQKRSSDSAFDVEFKRKQAERKRKYRARIASERNEGNEVEVVENTSSGEDIENSLVQEPKRSR